MRKNDYVIFETVPEENTTEENTWELASLFTEFPEPLGRVSFIQMYCKAHGKNIDLNSCWAVDDYLDMIKTEDYSLAQWFKDTCELYPETFE